MFYHNRPIPCVYVCIADSMCVFSAISTRTCGRSPKLDLKFEQLKIRHILFCESGKSSHIFGPRNASESLPCTSDLTARLLKKILS